MIKALIFRDHRGYLKTLEISGHGGIKGKVDPLCAAVTALAGSFGRLLESQDKIQWAGEAPIPGEYSVEVKEVPENRVSWFSGVSDLMIVGLVHLKTQYPDNIEVKIEPWEANNGS